MAQRSLPFHSKAYASESRSIQRRRGAPDGVVALMIPAADGPARWGQHRRAQHQPQEGGLDRGEAADRELDPQERRSPDEGPAMPGGAAPTASPRPGYSTGDHGTQI